MVDKVIKRDGSEESFIPEKLVVSAVKAGAKPKVARNIVEDMEKKLENQVETQKLKEMMLERLGEENPDWKENWQIYDRAVKRR
ncbi:MAG: ATP cone domain-containing protein [Candidatus Natronoplasma sp.]